MLLAFLLENKLTGGFIMKNNRMETLKANNVDCSKFFTLTAERDIPAGTKIGITIDTTNDPVANQIKESGYVRNTRLHRRWIAAHYFKLLNHPDGWYRAMNRYYSYMYQFDMMLEEVRVLSKLEKKDEVTFNERSLFFTHKAIKQILDDYVRDLEVYLRSLKVRHCKGKPYIRIPGCGDVFVSDIDSRIMNEIKVMAKMCHGCYYYSDIYDALKVLRKKMIKLPYDYKKSKVWINAFQSAGAFYTLKNLIMFHDVRLYYNGRFYGMNESMQLLEELAKTYEGYQLNGLLKEAIDKNHFDFKRSIEAHK